MKNNQYKLSDVCSIAAGGTPLRSKPEYWNGDIPWVKIRDFNGKYLNSTEETITKTGLDNSSAKIFPKDTILYSIFASLGDCSILNIDASTNQAIAGLQICDRNKLIDDYLYYYLLSKKNYVTSIGRGVAQNNINLSVLKNMDIVVPSMSIQQTICNVLNLVNETINNHKLQLENLDLLIKARFVEMFGELIINDKHWQTMPIAECAPIYNTNINCGNKVWLLNLDKVESQTGNIMMKDYVDLENVPSSVCQFSDNAVLYSKLRPYLNKVVIPDEPGFATSELIPLNPDCKLINKYYLAFSLRSEEFVHLISQKVAGAKMPRVNMKFFKNWKLPVPPLDLQNQFADFVTQVEKVKADVQKSLDKTQILFDSLMQQYFG